MKPRSKQNKQSTKLIIEQEKPNKFFFNQEKQKQKQDYKITSRYSKQRN